MENLAKAKAKAKASRWGNLPAPSDLPPRPPPPALPSALPKGFSLPSHYPDMTREANSWSGEAPGPDLSNLFLKGIPAPPAKPPVAQPPRVPPPPPPSVKIVRKAENREEHLMPAWKKQLLQQGTTTSEPDEGLGEAGQEELSPTPVFDPPDTPNENPALFSITSSPTARDFLGDLASNEAPGTPDFTAKEHTDSSVPDEGRGIQPPRSGRVFNKIKKEPKSPITPTSDAEFVSYQAPPPGAEPLQAVKFELPSEEDVAFVEHAIDVLGLDAGFHFTTGCMDALRVAVAQKQFLDEALLK